MLRVSSTSLPPSGMASRAFSARLRIAVESWLGSTSAVQASSASSGVIWICSPSVGCSSFAVSSTSALTSISRGCSGCLRAKASRCLVRLRAALGGFVDQLGDRGEFGLVGHGVGEDADRAGDDGQYVVEVVGDAAGQLADGVHFLGLPDLGLRGLLLREIAADEEMAPHRLRPRPHPVQRHRVTVPVEVARLEVAHLPAAPRRAHLVAGVVEVVGVNELDRRCARSCPPARTRGCPSTLGLTWTKLPAVGHEDQVLRGLEDALALLDLAVERGLRPLAFGDVAGDLGGADDLAVADRIGDRSATTSTRPATPCAAARSRAGRSLRRGDAGQDFGDFVPLLRRMMMSMWRPIASLAE